MVGIVWLFYCYVKSGTNWIWVRVKFWFYVPDEQHLIDQAVNLCAIEHFNTLLIPYIFSHHF